MQAEDRSKIVGKLEYQELIAIGGVAEIYRAQLSVPGGERRAVVVKRLLPDLMQSREVVERFLAEAALGTELRHPNLISVLAYGECNGEVCQVLEHVDGVALWLLLERLDERAETFPVGIGVAIAHEVCLGLAYAHGQRGPGGEPRPVLHRALSPLTVLISFEGQVKLADFGSAETDRRISVTEEGLVKGPAAYRSPEQVEGRPQDARSDLFSAGVLLYELLTGINPFAGRSASETTRRILQGDYLNPRKRNRAIDRKLGALIGKALESRPDRRFTSAGEMAAELRTYLEKTGTSFKPGTLANFVRGLYPARLTGSKAREVHADRRGAGPMELAGLRVSSDVPGGT